MVFPLVREMAATGAHIRVPVAVACRVDQELGISVGENRVHRLCRTAGHIASHHKKRAARAARLVRRRTTTSSQSSTSTASSATTSPPTSPTLPGCETSRAPQGRGKVRVGGLTCGDPDRRPRPASAGTSVAWICSWGVLLLPRSERPGGSSADETTALGAAPQPPHDHIRPGQVLVWRLCLGPGGRSARPASPDSA
jgi:hypothetical protein